eukprot:TRINITY_DN82994_c0_g1_i1.p1 TRINITY_DN82994_c0_g1~~TRINITY_DN82994_c0_g1_i1.p1  ORF type:complete len:315 (+),score=43.90 TRINITY_DN82994_c0_g1_i1:51-947(+)
MKLACRCKDFRGSSSRRARGAVICAIASILLVTQPPSAASFSRAARTVNMAEVYDELAERAVELYRSKGDRRCWIAIAGGPGAGKSTMAAEVSRLVAKNHGTESRVVPMDGYHLPLAALDAMPDPAKARRYRGAPFTFDGEQFVADISRATKEESVDEDLSFPGFDHAVGDPVEGEVVIPKDWHGIVFVEGLYLLLSQRPWSEAKAAFRETWFVDIARDVARMRVATRNAKAWNWDLERSLKRVDDNDLPNFDLVSRDKVRADRIIKGETSSKAHGRLQGMLKGCVDGCAAIFEKVLR